MAEGFDAWLCNKPDNEEALYDCRDAAACKSAYAAGHAAASKRVAELERERTLLVAEVRRCWELSKYLYSYFSLLWYRYGGQTLVKNIPSENPHEFHDALGKCKKLSDATERPPEVRAIVEAQP